MYFCPALKCTFFVVSIFQVAYIFGLFTLVSSSTDSSTLLFTISTCDFPEKGLCRLSHFWGWFREEEEPRKLVLWGTLKLATAAAAAGAKQPRLVDQEKRRYFVLRHPKPLQRGSNAWICSTTQQLMTTELLPPTFYFNKHPLNFSVADYSGPLGSITRLYVLIFHLHCSS